MGAVRRKKIRTLSWARIRKVMNPLLGAALPAIPHGCSTGSVKIPPCRKLPWQSLADFSGMASCMRNLSGPLTSAVHMTRIRVFCEYYPLIVSVMVHMSHAG